MWLGCVQNGEGESVVDLLFHVSDPRFHQLHLVLENRKH